MKVVILRSNKYGIYPPEEAADYALPKLYMPVDDTTLMQGQREVAEVMKVIPL